MRDVQITQLAIKTAVLSLTLSAGGMVSMVDRIGNFRYVSRVLPFPEFQFDNRLYVPPSLLPFMSFLIGTFHFTFMSLNVKEKRPLESRSV
jgi:hypothetical protein